MKFTFKHYLLLITWLMSSTVNAALISHNGYTLDTNTSVISDGNLEWLQWDQTAGLSINDALSLNTGWTLASTQQVSSLYTSFFSNTVWPATEDTTTTENLTYGDDDSGYLNFISLFGFTAQSFDTGTITFTDSYHMVKALFGSDADNDGLYQKATAVDDSQFKLSGELRNIGAFAELTADEYDRNYANAFTGVALVRQATPTDIPEPSTVVLVVLAIFSLLINSQRHTKLV